MNTYHFLLIEDILLVGCPLYVTHLRMLSKIIVFKSPKSTGLNLFQIIASDLNI